MSESRARRERENRYLAVDRWAALTDGVSSPSPPHGWFLVLNIFFLMVIAIMPFPNALLAEYLLEPEQQGVAIGVTVWRY